MSVERRYTKRQPVRFSVSVRDREGRPSFALARDLSREGMFLEVRSALLNRGSLVDLEFTHSGEKWRFAALLVHKSDRGIGVMFLEPQLVLLRA